MCPVTLSRGGRTRQRAIAAMIRITEPRDGNDRRRLALTREHGQSDMVLW
jgi:hypothetical protein